jgi:RNA polymerase sigma-70 factor (ECF subfamily)
VSPGEALSLAELKAPAAPAAPAAPLSSGRAAARLEAIVNEHSAFVWRSLLRLGVARADAEDAVQQVFLVAARRLGDIEVGREHAFLFSTALRIASRSRRTRDRRREVLEETPDDRIDEAAGPDELIDHARARVVLDAILDTMPLELRAVFVLFELEQVTTSEISAVLELPPGTVASRLRRAREHFQAAVKRIAAQRSFRGESP